MQSNRQTKRKGRQLLVAAVGIASVSYVGTIQGCADTGPEEELGEGSLVAEDVPEVAESQQALVVSHQAIDARAVSAQSIAVQILKRGGMPSSGNLMPTPGGTDPGGLPGGVIVIDDIPPVGNLMATPEIDQVAIDPAALQALEALGKQ
jgi:hypothetical protein